jgi:membrane-bound lytic murein transglycosylase D
MMQKTCCYAICLYFLSHFYTHEALAQMLSRGPASVVVDLTEQRTWAFPQYEFQKAMGYESNIFKTPLALEKEVRFWIDIYTKYTTRQGVFHISGDIEKIVGEIDLTDVYLNQKYSPVRREKEAEVLIRRKRKQIANQLKIKNVKSIRLQMGLKDRMKTAIYESGKYLPMMEDIFKQKNLPIELTRLVFVESSFNVEAQSRVGASGLWQIMPRLGRKFKYIDNKQDLRNNPRSATILAAKILKENYQILKSWPLAVTSYNFGVGSMLKVQKKLKTKDDQKIFSSENLKKHIGFASRNFYATFLAAIYVESHANLYFGEPLMIAKPLQLDQFYLSAKTDFTTLIQKHNMDAKSFKQINTHILSKHLKPGKSIPKGTLIHIPSNKVATNEGTE